MAAEASNALMSRLGGIGPKRILSIDGGGMRGALSAGILSEIERRLKRRSGKADFRLCDYFDLIGGASTGAILAAALAMGKTADEAARLYQDLAPADATGDVGAAVRRPRFDAARLDAVLAQELGDYELGSLALRTGFAVFTKRIDTGAAWSISNNPNAPFWEGGRGAFPNRRFPIRKLVMASAGGASLFEERGLRLAQENEPAAAQGAADGVFIDGAVAGLSDPSLQLLKLATLPPYGFGWGSGDDRLMVISVGSGYWRPALNQDGLERELFQAAPVVARAAYALRTAAHDAALQTLSTMQALSEPPKPWRINSELGEMRNARLSPVPVLHFQRFDARLDDTAELARAGLAYDKAQIEAMKDFLGDDGGTLARLHEIGVSAAQDYFKRGPKEPDWENSIFPARFDPAWFTGPPAGPARSRIEAMGRVFGDPKAKR